MVSFRKEVKTEDLVNVKRIIESSGFFHSFEIPIAVELVDERLINGADSGYNFVFAEMDHKTIAYSCYGEIPCTVGSFDLYWIAVHNDFRGKGIGEALIKQTEEEIKRNGGRGIYVETSSRDLFLPTRKFYEKTGYKPEATIKGFYAVDDDKIIYVKRL